MWDPCEGGWGLGAKKAPARSYPFADRGRAETSDPLEADLMWHVTSRAAAWVHSPGGLMGKTPAGPVCEQHPEA